MTDGKELNVAQSEFLCAIREKVADLERRMNYRQNHSPKSNKNCWMPSSITPTECAGGLSSSLEI